MQWPARIVALTTSCWNNRRVRVLSRVPGRRARRPVRCNTARAKSRAPAARVATACSNERIQPGIPPRHVARVPHAMLHAAVPAAFEMTTPPFPYCIRMIELSTRRFIELGPGPPGCTVRSMTMRRRSWWRGAASRRRPRSPRCNANTCCARHCTNAGPPCRKRSCRMAAEPCSSWRIRAGCRYPSQMSRSRGYPRFCGVRFARDCAGRDACGRHRASRACTASLPRG